MLSQFDCVTVGEGPGITNENALTYLEDKKGLNMIFHFGHMFIDQGTGGRFDPIVWSIDDFKKIFKTWDDAFSKLNATEEWKSEVRNGLWDVTYANSRDSRKFLAQEYEQLRRILTDLGLVN